MAFNKQQTGERTQAKEEYALVLDIIINTKNFNNTEIIQAIGMNNFTLLELVPKESNLVKTGQKVYIGDGKREEIQYIKRAIKYDELSGSAQSELLFMLIDIVNEREEEFVKFFNTAGPITIRQHSLESLPGLGKKHLTELLEERYVKPFESFENIKERCSYLHDPAKTLAERILIEIQGKDDFKFFVRK